MTQKQISDLSATDRLRSGTQLEIQDPINGSKNITADNLLAGLQWDTPSQITDPDGNIVEVEAHTLAARMRINPDETNCPQAGFTVGRYMISTGDVQATSPAYDNLTTAAVTDALILIFGWPCTGSICVPKKITGTLVTGALSGTRAGLANMKMWRVYGLSNNVGTSVGVLSPGSQGGTLSASRITSPALGSFGSLGLKVNQPPSQAHIERLVRSATQQGYVDQNPIGIVNSGALSVAGCNQINNATLYDYNVAEQPLILTPGTGFQVTMSLPAAGTSQTFDYFLNMQWDEWTPVSPGDR